MDSVLYTAASGMIAKQRELEVIANNLANASVNGFRPQTTFYEVWRRVGGPDGRTREGAANSGVQIPQTFISNQHGALLQTGAPLDIAIEGEAWLVVQGKGGTRYTRGGSLHLGSDGALTTDSGAPVLGDGGPIVLPQGRVEIGADGGISVAGAQVATLRLARVSPDDLTREGASLYRLRDGAGEQPAEAGDTVRQGSLETSGVNPVEELVRLVGAQRSYEQYARAVSLIMNEIDRKAVNDITQI